ncbi:hypothetical protein B484DRAFT_410588, partial [Ochromonadaceae sp. CCMP2298]
MDRLHLNPKHFLSRCKAETRPEETIVGEARAFVLSGEVTRPTVPNKARTASVAGRRYQRQINKLIDCGRVSAACQAAERYQSYLALDAQGERNLSAEERITLLSELNPPRTTADDLPAETDEDEMPIQFEASDLCGAVGKLNRNSSAGWTGWSNGAIITLLGGSGEAEDMEDQELAGTDGWRPLGIGECWYRLLSRMVVRKIVGKVSKALLPLQVGSGFSGGSEIAGRLAQLGLDMDNAEEGLDMALLSLDIKNAFNTIGRHAALNQELVHASHGFGDFNRYGAVAYADDVTMWGRTDA